MNYSNSKIYCEKKTHTQALTKASSQMGLQLLNKFLYLLFSSILKALVSYGTIIF